MNEIKLFIDNIGSGKVPDGWYLLHTIKMQRLYYIKGGIGTYSCDSKEKRSFEPGKIYLFPHNINIAFESDTENPVNHTYFDFISTPPIVSGDVIVYDVNEGSALQRALNLADTLFSEYNTNEMINVKIPHITSCEPGSFDEQRQTIYMTLKLILNLLSFEKAIPFSMDSIINRALEYIRKNYNQNLSIAELAAQFGLAENYFIRRFKSVMGQTPYAYLKTHRLLVARELIASGMSVSKAAELVGYETPSSLSRALGNMC